MGKAKKLWEQYSSEIEELKKEGNEVKRVVRAIRDSINVYLTLNEPAIIDAEFTMNGFSEFVAKDAFTEHLLIKHSNESSDLMGLFEKDIYRAYNPNKEIKYEAAGTYFFGRHKLRIHKGQKNLGTIRRTLIPYYDLDEDEYGVRKAKVSLDGCELFHIRGHKESGRLLCKLKRKNWSLKHLEEDSAYSLSYKKKEVARIYKLFNAWVLGYNGAEYEDDVVVMTVALWNLLRE